LSIHVVDVSGIVAEIGLPFPRVGFAGDDYPKARFPSNVAIIRNNERNQDSATFSRGNLVESIVHDFSLPLHEDLGDGKEASTLDGLWEAANPIHPITGLCSLRDDVQQQNDKHNTISKGDSSNTSISHPSSSGSQDHLSHQKQQQPKIPSSVSLELFVHMLEHGTASLGLGHSCNEGSWALPLFLLEKSYTPPKMRQTITEIVFEQLQVPKFFLGKDAAMACYAVGRTTGLVVDIGGLGTTVSPVHEGWVEGRGILRSPIGGDAMSSIMLQHLDRLYLKQSGNNNDNASMQKPHYAMPGYQVRTANYQMRKSCFHRLARLEMARHAMDSIAVVAEYGYDVSKCEETNDVTYELPDGTRIKIPAQTKYEFGELLLGRDDVSTAIREDFCVKQQKSLSTHPDLFALSGGTGDNHPSAVAKTVSSEQRSTSGYLQWTSASLQNIICDAAFRCDRDQQAQLLGNVILTGGGACIPILTGRIREEGEIVIHTHTPGWRVKVSSPSFRERSVGSWLGGSIVASLATFSDMWITKAEYEESGATIVNRKCP